MKRIAVTCIIMSFASLVFLAETTNENTCHRQAPSYGNNCQQKAGYVLCGYCNGQCEYCPAGHSCGTCGDPNCY